MCTRLPKTGPIYSPAHSLAQSAKSLIAPNSTEKASENSTTQQILAELQPIYQEANGHSFIESLAIVSLHHWPNARAHSL